MSDKKQFTIVMLIASFFVAWIVYSNMSIIFINNIVLEDKELGEYPYPFRILRKDANTAVMGTLRSADVPASIALRLLFPELENSADNSKQMQYAQKEMARLQAKAKSIVLSNSGFENVRWEIDENWFRVQGIKPKKRAS
ncbi:hypothetical protein [Alkalimarinus coralli]|uniref:hypothetical protein n=1 Tax=Alkalimarinus coralli TaxID=2935863 RepID=UPI00202B563A|nr:hypothetical protein [Alkalimarinus coralli]